MNDFKVVISKKYSYFQQVKLPIFLLVHDNKHTYETNLILIVQIPSLGKSLMA